MTNQLSVVDQPSQLSAVDQVVQQKAQLDELMRKAMKAGEDFGVVPGTSSKPSLFKPGAEKISRLFNLAAAMDVTQVDLPNGHREVKVKCTLTHRVTKEFVGDGVGSCTTMESRYRWRGGSRLCPECGKACIKKSKYPPRDDPDGEPGYYCYGKIGGCGANFDYKDRRITDQSEERQENPDLADSYNTVLKMAKKRAFVDAILTATAASAAFTQDVEDMAANAGVADAPEPPKKPATKGRTHIGPDLAQELYSLSMTRQGDYGAMVAGYLKKYKAADVPALPIVCYHTMKAKILDAPLIDVHDEGEARAQEEMDGEGGFEDEDSGEIPF